MSNELPCPLEDEDAEKGTSLAFGQGCFTRLHDPQNMLRRYDSRVVCVILYKLIKLALSCSTVCTSNFSTQHHAE